eukprot:scaffold209711_cov15-Tisochrysis_lutea.AAC.1
MTASKVPGAGAPTSGLLLASWMSTSGNRPAVAPEMASQKRKCCFLPAQGTALLRSMQHCYTSVALEEGY